VTAVVLINTFELPEGQDEAFPGASGPATNPYRAWAQSDPANPRNRGSDMTTDNPQGGVLRVPGRPDGRRMRKRAGL
jgi:hypothetical protein